MSSFSKFSSVYRDTIDDVLEKLNFLYLDKLKLLFVGRSVDFSLPDGGGFNYSPKVLGEIKDVSLKLSRPDIDIPMIICKFLVEGVDQHGVFHSTYVNEKDLPSLSWEGFTQFSKVDLVFFE